MLYFSAVVSSGTSFAYLVDTHGPTGAVHIVALANCVMVMLEYGAAFCANRIVLARGVRASLLVLGAGQAVCWLAAVAMYVFGKRVRSFVSVFLHLLGPGRRLNGLRIPRRSRAILNSSVNTSIYLQATRPNLWLGCRQSRSTERAAGKPESSKHSDGLLMFVLYHSVVLSPFRCRLAETTLGLWRIQYKCLIY